MTNLGAGFPVGSPETTGPPPPSSSGPPSERDRYRVVIQYLFSFYFINQINNGVHVKTQTISLSVLQSAVNASTPVACEWTETQDGGEKGTARPRG